MNNYVKHCPHSAYEAESRLHFYIFETHPIFHVNLFQILGE